MTIYLLVRGFSPRRIHLRQNQTPVEDCPHSIANNNRWNLSYPVLNQIICYFYCCFLIFIFDFKFYLCRFKMAMRTLPSLQLDVKSFTRMDSYPRKFSWHQLSRVCCAFISSLLKSSPEILTRKKKFQF